MTMMPSLAQNVLMLPLMMFLHDMRILVLVNQELVWTMNMVVVVLNMEMLMVTGWEDLVWGMVEAAEVQCLVRIPMGCIAVDKAWVMVEVPLVIVMLVGCTHQVMVVITFHEEVMLEAAHTQLCILAGVWVVVAVTWVVEVAPALIIR